MKSRALTKRCKCKCCTKNGCHISNVTTSPAFNRFHGINCTGVCPAVYNDPRILTSYNHWFLQQGMLHPWVLQPGVLRKGVLTTMACYNKPWVLSTKGSYNRGFTNEILTPRGLKTGGSYNKEAYIRKFLQPGFLQSGVIHVQPGLVTSRSLTTRVSYNHFFL